MAGRTVSRAERTGSARLWIGVLGGPVAWSLQILIGYNLEEIACRTGATSERILGADLEAIIVGLTAVLMALTVLCGLIAYGCLRKMTGETDDTSSLRAVWMARAGIITSALFTFMLLLGLFPPLFLATCEPSL
ncbi:MAG: hypothetical protein ACRDJL_07210 [Actinomycetota bacterium]